MGMRPIDHHVEQADEHGIPVGEVYSCVPRYNEISRAAAGSSRDDGRRPACDPARWPPTTSFAFVTVAAARRASYATELALAVARRHSTRTPNGAKDT